MSSQEENVDVCEEVKQLVSVIIAKNKLKPTSQVKYNRGSQAGDGYSTNTVFVDIVDGETSIKLFLKCTIDVSDTILTAKILRGLETFFYETIYPTYTEFLKNKDLVDGFLNVPVCYGCDVNNRNEIIALENLREKGFTMFDRFTYMNDEHLKLILRSFAKFHAVSFAVKDQRKDLHDKFCERCPYSYGIETMFADMVRNMLKGFLDQLDPVEDKDILEKCGNLPSKVHHQILNMNDYYTDYAILTKGDCWANNMMILYEENDREHPIDLMLIDWQCVMRASPVTDIGPVFYPVASKETVDNYKYYLQIYYEELSARIRELGSDPEVLYPRSIFEKEWVDYGLYSLGYSFFLIKVLLCKTEDVRPFERDMEHEEIVGVFSNVKTNEEEFVKRGKYIIRHMIEIGVL